MAKMASRLEMKNPWMDSQDFYVSALQARTVLHRNTFTKSIADEQYTVTKYQLNTHSD